MRTSLNEIKLIDEHIFNKVAAEDALLFDALLILDPGLLNRVTWQKHTHAIVMQYGRKKLVDEIEKVHHQLFSEPRHHSFKQRIMGLFK